MNGARKPRRVRWPATTNTLALALDGAAKPAWGDIHQILQTMAVAFKAMREGVATELQWSILAGGLDMSKAIERQGVVRGLSGHLAAAETALQHIYDRAKLADGWRPTVLYFNELEDIKTFVNLHAFQFRQLSRGELKRAIASATGQIRSNGGKVNLADSAAMERMAT